MMDWSPGCYIPSFVEIGPPVPEKKIFEGFLPYVAWWPSWSCDQHHINKFYISKYLRAYIQNLVRNGPVVSRKSMFKFSYINDPVPRLRSDFDLQYLHTFNYIKSIRCLQLPTFRSQASTVSKKSIVFTFSHRKAYVTKFDLAVK